ncbi:MAG: hypothetical protein D6719_03520 [Candidatus Dadabacteria bacterium]|nr:MAG: hypothetical protein D6719_03520 [Candidatus Dadabacteria bacterium]
MFTAESSAESALGLKFKGRITDDPEAPLVFMVHGRAGNYDVMWAFRRTVPDSFHILTPQAPFADSIGGYSWWHVDRQDSLQTEGIAALKSFILKAPEYYQLKPRAKIALGFSQGGAALSVVFQDHPGIFDGLGLLASFVLKKEEALVSLTHTAAVFIAHGEKDPIVPLNKALEARSYFESLGYKVTFVADPVTHKVGTAGMKALKAWLAQWE